MSEEIQVKHRFFKAKQNNMLLYVLLAAFLTVLALMVLVRFPKGSKMVTVTQQNGVYDLTGITDFKTGFINLLPPETYYPNTYLSPDTANQTIPEPTSHFSEIRTDYLSQRFILIVPDDDVYTLTFHLSGRHAMRVYVNGRLEGETGHLGTTKKDTEVWENNITVNAAPKGGKMDIILNSAQFYHIKRGASLAELSIKKSGVPANPLAVEQMKGLAVMGALFCAMALLIGVYGMLSRTRATLYFALACLAMTLREYVQSQVWTSFPISGNLSFMLEYLSVVLLTIFLSLYLGQYATTPVLRIIEFMSIAGSFIYGGCILFGDSLFYTFILGFYQVWLVLCIVPGISVLFFHMRRPTKEQAAALYGIAVFFLAALSDIAMYRNLGGHHTNVPISETAMLVFVLAQTVSLFIMNNRVLTEAKEAEQTLTAEKNALESLNQLKTEFLGNASHELKTPLTVMSGYAQTVKHLAEHPEPLNREEISRRMSLISSEAERLSLMVGQILDVTRMDEGRMVMEPVSCYADEIIHSAVETHYPILNKNHNRMDIHIESGLPVIYADPARISQVIVNLISNAVRFTSEGVITISAKRDGDHILICVSDTGIGISSHRIPYLFERYTKKERSGTGQSTGTGLGLYICKHIVEQHGGTIWIESIEGHGTCVSFTLPVS